MNSGHMNFFKINECGLYKVGKNSPYGCEIEETLDLITEWFSTVPFSHTIPWDSAKKNSSRTKCYCQDIYKDSETGDYVLVLWKSDTDSAGTLWGANSKEKGKVVKYTSSYQGDDVIWGRPCYYWVIPKLNTVISIKFDNSVCDAAMFKDWISSALTNKAKHPNRIKHTTEHGHIRLSISDEKSDPYKYIFRFDISLRSLNTSSIEIAELQQKVTHLVKRETVEVATKDARDEWVKIFDALPFLGIKPKSKKRRIEIKAEAKPTVNEIKEIIETYASERNNSEEWDRVGFELQDKTITWVDRYRLKEYITIPSDAPDIMPASFLFEELRKNRSRYVSPLIRSDETYDEELDLQEFGT
ncbi:hypothetical protein D3C77_337700 [compost metagenome]